MKRNSISDWKMMSTKAEKTKMVAAKGASAAAASDRELVLTREKHEQMGFHQGWVNAPTSLRHW